MLTYDYEILNMLTLEEAIGIALFKVKLMANILRNSYKNYSNIMRCLFTTLPPVMKTVHCLLQKMTGIIHISYDICRNECYCYAKSSDL